MNADRNEPASRVNTSDPRELTMFASKAAMRLWQGALIVAIGAALTVMAPAYGAEGKPEPTKAAAPKQKTYASAEEAVKDLMAAAKTGDSKALLVILGADAKAILSSGDPVADREGREAFVKSYEEANKLEKSGDAKVILNTGKDAWPFPIPIVKESAGWRFDTNAGKEEILNRRVGRNELAVIQVVQAYVDAQREYYLRNAQGDKLLQYAQKFASTPGKRDGLYWPAKAGEKPSPLGPLVAGAKTEGYA